MTTTEIIVACTVVIAIIAEVKILAWIQDRMMRKEIQKDRAGRFQVALESIKKPKEGYSYFGTVTAEYELSGEMLSARQESIGYDFFKLVADVVSDVPEEARLTRLIFRKHGGEETYMNAEDAYRFVEKIKKKQQNND